MLHQITFALVASKYADFVTSRFVALLLITVVAADALNARSLPAPITTAKAFAQLAHDEVADAKYSREAVEGTFLKVGAIVGLKTNEGNYAKLTVIGYRDSHDFSFDSAKLIPADRRAVTMSRPNIPNYHLELRWVLWEK